MEGDGTRTWDRQSVVALIERLVEERQDPTADSWENDSVERYLDALGGWLSSSAGYYRNNFGREVPENVWEVLADALQAARTYE